MWTFGLGIIIGFNVQDRTKSYKKTSIIQITLHGPH